MNFIEKVGNIKVYEDRHHEQDTTIYFYNGSDLIATEVYFTANTSAAIADLFQKVFDIYTEKFVYSIFLEKHSSNTYQTSEKDWFCRIDGTKYFKHYYRSADEFIKDKNGFRIIDK